MVKDQEAAIIVDFINMSRLLSLLDNLKTDILTKEDEKFVRLIKKAKLNNC